MYCMYIPKYLHSAFYVNTSLCICICTYVHSGFRIMREVLCTVYALYSLKGSTTQKLTDKISVAFFVQEFMRYFNTLFLFPWHVTRDTYIQNINKGFKCSDNLGLTVYNYIHVCTCVHILLQEHFNHRVHTHTSYK